MTALSSPQQDPATPERLDGADRAGATPDHTPRVGGGHRHEIDGLRAVAVLLVAVYHVWFGRVSGGVDVFLLLTGFLITGSLVRASERGGIRYGAFLSRAVVHDFMRGNTREDVEAWMVWKGLAGKELARRFVELATSPSAGEYGGIRRLEKVLMAVSRRFPGQEITSELVLDYMRQARGQR